jgi:hypothetical protein
MIVQSGPAIGAVDKRIIKPSVNRIKELVQTSPHVAISGVMWTFVSPE